LLAFISAAVGWLRQEGDLFPAPPEVILAGSVAEATAAVARCERAGAPINVAIVDLGLGPGKPSGLGVIELLERAAVPAAVYTDYGEGARRLMFVYAAFAWYRPAALLPKSHFSVSAASEDTGRAFASAVARICARQPVNPELTAHFRPAIGRKWQFERVLSSRDDLLKWRAFVTYSQTTAVAASLGLSRRTIENWLADKYDAVWELLQHASKYMDVADAWI